MIIDKKKKILIGLTILASAVAVIAIIVLLILNKDKDKVFEPGQQEVLHTIYFCSDTHLLSNNLVSPAEEKMKYITDGRVQKYDYELVKALVDKVNAEKPEALIISGDLSFNGEKDSHIELAKLLSDVNKDTKVLVIPGNHDICNLTPIYDNSVEVEEFREIYKDFGYSGALFYDQDSLSYAYEVGDDFLILMLDTTLCRYNKEESRNIIGGMVEYSTFEWLEEILKNAQQKGQRVVSVTHHNLIDHNTNFLAGYTLIENEKLLELYSKYDVTLNFSGHLHIQNISSAEVNDKTIYDVANSSLLTYGNTYGILKVYEEGFTYEKERLEPFEGFSKVSFDNFKNVYINKSIGRYMESFPDNYADVINLISEVNTYYFDGDYVAIHKYTDANKALVKKVINSGNNYNNSIFNTSKEDQRILKKYWK